MMTLVADGINHRNERLIYLVHPIRTLYLGNTKVSRSGFIKSTPIAHEQSCEKFCILHTAKRRFDIHLAKCVVDVIININRKAGQIFSSGEKNASKSFRVFWRTEVVTALLKNASAWLHALYG